MPKISFNAKALGITTYKKSGDMRRTPSGCAFEPVMVFKPGIEAIIEGLRLANVEGFEHAGREFPAKDVNR
jgi:hypothetical protein